MRIYFVGIKGVGMAGLAIIAKQQGHEVSGCDVGEKFITDKPLKNSGIVTEQGFKRSLPAKTDLVIFTGAHRGADNPLVVRAKARGIKTFSYARGLAFLCSGKELIAVAGTHGKTTTTAMLALILKKAGFHPSWLVGTGKVGALGLPAHWDKQGKYFVVEADEYPADFPRNPRPKFLYLSPKHLIITSVDWDHPDVYKSPSQFAKPFKKLLKKVPASGYIIMPAGFPELHRFSKGARGKVRWLKPSQYFPGLKLLLPGKHYLTDASLAGKLAHELGVGKKTITSSLNSFRGTNRRFEILGKLGQKLVLDDYAHHPTEIKATLEALREKYPQRALAVIFESHTTSRTKAFANSFAKELARVDYLALAPIFASARKQRAGKFSDQDFLKIVKKRKPDTYEAKTASQAYNWIKEVLPENAVVVTMGAGKIWQWGELFLLKEKASSSQIFPLNRKAP